MTLKQAFKIRIIEKPERYKPRYHICYFEDGDRMETEYTVSSATTSEDNLKEFWKDFCKCNNLKENSIASIVCVGDGLVD